MIGSSRVIECLLAVFLCYMCLSLNFSSALNVYRIFLVKRKGSKGGEKVIENLLNGGIANHCSGLTLNVTVLEGSSHFTTLSRFCEEISSGGPSMIVSLDQDAHPKLLDQFASFAGIPLIKIFNHECLQKKEFYQETNTILHIGPDCRSRLQVIMDVLVSYHWETRIVVISEENNVLQKNMAVHLLEILRGKPEISLNIAVHLTWSYNNEDVKMKSINILSALRPTAVVILMDQYLSADLLQTAKHNSPGWECIWILGNSDEDFENVHFAFPSDTLEIRFVSDAESSLSPTRSQFITDSLNLFTQAIQRILKRGINISEPPNSCSCNKSWQSGRLLYREMKLTKMTVTGSELQFDSNGFRANVAYEVDYWMVDESGTKKMTIARYQDNKFKTLLNGWPPIDYGDVTLERKVKSGKPLRVTVSVLAPYVMYNEIDTIAHRDRSDCGFGMPCTGKQGEQYCCIGYCIDLIKMLTKDIKFTVDINFVKDDKYGALNTTTGRWSGMVGEVTRGEADIALGDLTINQQRSAVVDFTHPIMDAGMGVMVKTYRRAKSNWTAFLDPFSVTLWLCILIIVNIVLVCMWTIERFSPYGQRRRRRTIFGKTRKAFGFLDTIWFTWSLVFQSFDFGKRPKSLSCRVLALFFAFAMLICVTSYTANLAAFLVVEEEILPLSKNGIRDVKLQNPPAGFKIATIKDTSFDRFFQASEDPALRRVWHYMKPHSVESFLSGIREMNAGNLQAFVSDEPTFEYFASKSKDCSFKIVGKSFFQSGFGMAVRKNSTFTTTLSKQLIQYEEYDIVGKLRNRWFAGQCEPSQTDDEATFASLSKKHLAGMFLAICISIVVCGMFSIMESHSRNIYSKMRKFIFNKNY